MNTYDKRCQIAASRRQLEDAQALYNQKRWLGSIYLGGYAIECALKALICYEESQDNFRNTKIFKKGMRGSELHNLTKLLGYSNLIQRAISLDRTKDLENAWKTVSNQWRNAELRYSRDLGTQTDSEKFIAAVEILHKLFLQKQGLKQ